MIWNLTAAVINAFYVLMPVFTICFKNYFGHTWGNSGQFTVGEFRVEWKYLTLKCGHIYYCSAIFHW